MPAAPPVPKTIQQITSRRGALSVADIVSAQRSTGSAFHSQNAEALQRLNQYSDLLNGSVNSIGQYIQGLAPFLANLITFQTVPLLNPITNILPIVDAGSGLMLVVAMEQDATGGRQITWSPSFRFAPVDIFGDPFTWSVFPFMSGDVGAGPQWVMIAQPLTGVL